MTRGPAAATRTASAGSALVAAQAPDTQPARERIKAQAQARLERLGLRIQPIVARYKREASERSKGHVSAGEMHVAVHLRDLESGAEFGIGASRPMRPASNMKLVTTAAALTLLGSDWRFDTPIEATAAIVGGRLQGDLVLRASGDPLYDISGAGRARLLLAPALDELERAGLKNVSGDMILDEGSFDAPAPPPGWPGADQRFQEYCALSGGFSINRGCLTIRVAPGSVGAPADIDVQPAGFGLERQYSAMTAAAGKLTIGFDARSSGLIVRGSIPAKSQPFTGSCPVPDPVDLFACVLRHELGSRGIRIEGKNVRQRGAPGGDVLARINTPLLIYLQPINQESNNAVADQVFLGTAQAFLGSAARKSAERATLAALERLHVLDDGFRQVDGSGLSDLNRVSARQLSALIHSVLSGDARVALAFRESLAIAGVSGTLDKRMQNSPAKGRVFAKTGFIAGTSALSGVALGADDRQLVFSILVNYEEFGGLNTSVWKPMEDEICGLLVGARP